MIDRMTFGYVVGVAVGLAGGVFLTLAWQRAGRWQDAADKRRAAKTFVHNVEAMAKWAADHR